MENAESSAQSRFQASVPTTASGSPASPAVSCGVVKLPRWDRLSRNPAHLAGHNAFELLHIRVVPVAPRLLTLESWPYPIVQLALKNSASRRSSREKGETRQKIDVTLRQWRREPILLDKSLFHSRSGSECYRCFRQQSMQLSKLAVFPLLLLVIRP
jgi:hypothetical protein